MERGSWLLIRDRDRIYGDIVTRRLRAMGIRDKPTAPVSPWQNARPKVDADDWDPPATDAEALAELAPAAAGLIVDRDICL